MNARWLLVLVALAIPTLAWFALTGDAPETTPSNPPFVSEQPAAQASRSAAQAATSPPSESAPSIANEAPAAATRYFFDVFGHSPEEIMAVLKRAEDTYDNLPASLQGGLSIAMVIHGPDVDYFATDQYEKYKDLVDLAARLDAFGFVDMKMCTASVRSRGFETDRFPPFIELVPYGPREISRLQEDGYIQL